MRRRCPWEEAEQRRPAVEVRNALLPDACGGAVVQRRPGRSWIVLDLRLSPVEQRCKLAHELVHLERGSARCNWTSPAWDRVVVAEEQRVDEVVAEWLVPDHELWPLIEEMVAMGVDVTRRVIAAEFQVTKPIAGIALNRLAGRRGEQVA